MTDSNKKISRSKRQLERRIRAAKISAYIANRVAVYIFAIGISAVLGIIIYQIYSWLQTGNWKPLSAMVLLSRILPADFLLWLADESSWVGLKKIILWITKCPLSVFLFLFCFSLGWMFYGFAESEKEEASDNAQKGGWNN